MYCRTLECLSATIFIFFMVSIGLGWRFWQHLCLCCSGPPRPAYLGMGWEVGTTGTNLGQLAICSCTLEQETMWDLIFTRVTWEQTHDGNCSQSKTALHMWSDSTANRCRAPTFLLQPLQGALNEASCFSTLEERSTFLGSKGTRQSGQRGEVTWRQGWRHSPQNLE